ncbi:MAG: leucine-rich repeat domain-containing protein [Bacteroidetes bacterium]|nr:leucine-rich repeat domain-containing protein [Bacteroidota bacterium]
MSITRYFLLIFLFTGQLSRAQDVPSVQLIDDTNYIYRSISVALQNPEKVFRLNLSKTKMKEIPADIFKFTNLRELDFSKNRIDSIPHEIGSLTMLTSLNLSGNNLEMLPDEIGQLSSLTYLNLNRNRIVALPSTIGNLSNLEILELWDNELYGIPDQIGNLKKLKALELRGILFSDDEAARIDSLLPNTKVFMSPTCNCKF